MKGLYCNLEGDCLKVNSKHIFICFSRYYRVQPDRYTLGNIFVKKIERRKDIKT